MFAHPVAMVSQLWRSCRHTCLCLRWSAMNPGSVHQSPSIRIIWDCRPDSDPHGNVYIHLAPARLLSFASRIVILEVQGSPSDGDATNLRKLIDLSMANLERLRFADPLPPYPAVDWNHYNLGACDNACMPTIQDFLDDPVDNAPEPLPPFHYEAF
ncbi:hypothetical protein C8Q76DRAFT_784145, partial [Earliella scabrosa]